MSTSPEELKIKLHEKIYRLIQFKFAEYLNLLYIVDVNETEIKKLDGSNISELAGQVSFLILKREWQKCGLKIGLSKILHFRQAKAPCFF